MTTHAPLGGGATDIEWFGTVPCLEDSILQVCTCYVLTALSHQLKVYPTGEEGGVPVSKPLKVEGIHYGEGR